MMILFACGGHYRWLPAVLLIAFSCIYLHVHYPSDVLAGCLVGICLGYAMADEAVRLTRRDTLKSDIST
ncbi:MAG: phosphatase PAP2 family protein [Holdemania massiliensis]